MRLLLALATCVWLASPALAADDSCAGYERGETKELGRIVETSSTFAAVGAGATVERSVELCGSENVELHEVLVYSTDCADCDVWITTVSGAGGTGIVWSKDDMTNDTVNGTAYTTYYSAVVNRVFTPSLSSGERVVYVRVTNNDGGARTVVVKLQVRS